MKKVTVIGLGSMGATLARLLLEKGYTVYVWNRTPGKAQSLVERGAIATVTAAEAIAQGEIVVVCVHDYHATWDILDTPAVTSAISGKTLVQLTTGSPREAKESLAWADKYGAHYIDGAIQVAPSQMGLPDTTILASGREAALESSRGVLQVFGGNIAYLGESISAAATMDLATLSYVYGAILGFMQGALFSEAEGLDVRRYAEIVQDMSPSYGEFLKFEGNAIAKGDYKVMESPLSISTEATARIAQEARSMGIHTAMPDIAAQLFQKASDAGYGKEELAALIKIMR